MGGRRKQRPASDLLIQRVKRETGLSVTTGEICSAWSYHPSLASAVDFIAAHVLPYWEGVSETAAVDQAIHVYDKLRQAYPGKRIVIAEFGWPSAGYNRRDANPDPLVQARVLRSFVARAEALGIDYNIIEAYDQPWKTFEGGVGPYWGMFDTSRQPKFSWTGPITDPDHWKLAGIAVLIGVLLSLPILSLAAATAGQTALLATTAHIVGAWFAILFAYWNGHYFVTGAAIAYGARAAAAPAADLHRDEAHRGDRQHRVRHEAEPPDRIAAARAGTAVRAQGLDPHPGLPRAAGDDPADARCGGAARIPELRVHHRHQQHARSGAVAPDRGALQDARRALQVRARGQARRLQGRRAPPGADPHRGRRRDHRRARCRLRRAFELAERSDAAVRRSQGRPRSRRRRIIATASARPCIRP